MRREQYIAAGLWMVVNTLKTHGTFDWYDIPVEAQTQAMFIVNRLAAQFFIRNPWKGIMSEEQRVALIRALEEEIEAIDFQDSVMV